MISVVSSCLASYWKSLQHSSPLLSMSQAEAELRVREQETINNLQSVSLTTSRMDTKQYVLMCVCVCVCVINTIELYITQPGIFH